MSRRDALWALAPLGLGLLLAVWVLAAVPQRASAGTDRYVIPAGTAARVREGLPVDGVLPRRIDTAVGRALVVENADTVDHVFGPFVLAPGQRWERRFATPGEYSVACSVYPATGFTVGVRPAPGSAGPADAARWLTIVVWALAGALAVGYAGAVLVTVGEPPAGPGGAGAGLVAPGPPDPVAPARGRLSSAAMLLPGASAAVALVTVAALTRVAPARVALTSDAALAALVALVVTLGAVLFVRRVLGPAVTSAPTPGRGVLGLWLLAAALMVGWGPVFGWPALGWGLATAGLGLLVVALLPWRPGGLSPADRRWLAAAGCALFVAGLPWPGVDPAWQAGAAAIALLGCLLLAGLAARAKGPGPAWLAAGAALLALTWGALLGTMAIAGHIEATTVPVVGNPVRADAASVARGEALWRSHCAACHAAPGALELGDQEDRALLGLITHGRDATKPGSSGMPGFAYRLDWTERGDLVNYLRSAAGR